MMPVLPVIWVTAARNVVASASVLPACSKSSTGGRSPGSSVPTVCRKKAACCVGSVPASKKW
jgi:hypothetical protein